MNLIGFILQKTYAEAQSKESLLIEKYYAFVEEKLKELKEEYETEKKEYEDEAENEIKTIEDDLKVRLDSIENEYKKNIADFEKYSDEPVIKHIVREKKLKRVLK